jgi:predicted DNA-binding transcriptional regulator AlpA
MATANERTIGGEPIKLGESVKDGPEGFITKPTVAQRMQKCTRTIDNLMAVGLPHYKVGRSVIFRWAEVEAYLAANCRVSRRGSN